MSNQKIQDSLIKCNNALNALNVSLGKPVDADRCNIDATIQRFEFVVELFWKLLKRILEFQGAQAVYPKEVLRLAYNGKLIEDESLWLSMLQDRNMTSHTYDMDLADDIYSHIPKYYDIMRETLDKLQRTYATT